jgi:hypothetical protein
MGMTPDREEYFMDRMQALADIFESYAGHHSSALDDIPAGTLTIMEPSAVKAIIETKDPEIFRLKDEYMRALDKLTEEFDGESDHEGHWTELMTRSGAMARMDAALGMGP